MVGTMLAEGYCQVVFAVSDGYGCGMKIPVSMPRLKGFRFPREIICYAVWADHRFALSTADVEDLLAERGVLVSRESVRQWVNRFGRHFADCIKRDRPSPRDKWHLDEVVILIGGSKHWLWQAINAAGDVLDIPVQPRRNAKAAKRFLRRLTARFGDPRVVVTDRLRGYIKPILNLAPGADHRATGPPGAQGPQQQGRGLSPSNATARENHGAVQVTPAGPEISFRSRPDQHPLPGPPLQTLFNFLPPRPFRRISVVEWLHPRNDRMNTPDREPLTRHKTTGQYPVNKCALSMNGRHTELLSRCLSIDLEVDPKTARIFALAAVWNDDRPALKSGNGLLDGHIDQLEEAVAGIAHPIGHNFLQHDMEHLIAARPRLARIIQGPIDTLWLNPLAFPRNPYHHLVKHYHDGRLAAGHINDPELDARLVFEVLSNQLDAFRNLAENQPDALVAYHYLTTRMERSSGFDAVFRYLRNADCPSHEDAFAAMHRMLNTRACSKRIEQTLGRLADPRNGWPIAYALSWITVAGGDSVMPPWVRAQFREASLIVRHLRDISCKDPGCDWCSEQNDPVRALNRWFGFESFRPQPVDSDGRPLQERIVDEAMSGTSLLGILPTGTGKSVCYQVPALSRFDKTGALTVVISPLVALMADQVQGMERADISCSVTINGMMSMPERQAALDEVRMGDAGILIISPEQLRSTSIRSVLAQREVGLWAIDEAHCVSKWGHDFRPDYRYLGRFIKEFSGDQLPAPIICLTATARPEVVADIMEHFQSRAGIELLPLDGGASRKNLRFDVRPTTKNSKLTDVLNVIEELLLSDGRSGAVVYCATRKETERLAEFLKSQGMDAAHFHAGLGSDDKQDVQERFRVGDLRVITATNAFGMGIDKPDIRLVVHADIPGSLENYLQEAGRAGRDREDADCVLLFAADDVERQFRLTAGSRLARHEIGAILRALRRIDERTRKTGKIVATAGEIVRSEKDREFERDSATDDTRVKTAVSWLEEATLVSREENRVQIFPSSLRIRTMDEAKHRLADADITEKHSKQLLAIVQHLISAPADEGVSTDQLYGVSGLTPGALAKAMANLESLGIARNDVAITVFVHVGVAQSSEVRLTQAASLERDLIALLREMMPDADKETPLPLNLSEACQRLRDLEHPDARPDIVDKLVRGISRDGRGQDGGRGNIRLSRVSRNTLNVTLERSWKTISQTAELRWQAADILLRYLTGRLDKGARGKDL